MPDALPLHPAGPAAPAAAAPLLAGAREAARLCAISEATWWRLHAARRTPAPIKIGHRTLRRTSEIREWTEAGAPCRSVWEALRGRGRQS
jgi:predicted DNA-binding transcriptional regulator AlpA